MIDLVTFGVLALAAWLGWRKGTLLMLLGVLALVAGYVAAVLLFRPVGNGIASAFPSIPPLVALPVAGMLVMFFVTTIIRLAMRTVARRRALARQQGEMPGPADSAGGAAIGALQASAYVIVAAWALMSVQSIIHQGPDISRSLTGRATSAVTQRATYALTRRITGDPLVANMMSVVATHPKEGVAAVNALMRNPSVQGLWTNPSLRQALARGDSAALANNPAVHEMANDPGFRTAAAQLGLTPSRQGGEALAQELVARVTPLARTVQSLSTDPEVKRMMDNPEFRRMVDQGNFAALAASPQFNQLAARILAGLRQGGTAP